MPLTIRNFLLTSIVLIAGFVACSLISRLYGEKAMAQFREMVPVATPLPPSERQIRALESLAKAQWQEVYWQQRQVRSVENACCQCE